MAKISGPTPARSIQLGAPDGGVEIQKSGHLPADSLQLQRQITDSAKESWFSRLMGKISFLWAFCEVKMGWMPRASASGELTVPIPRDGFRRVLAIAPHPGDTSLDQKALAVYQNSIRQREMDAAIAKLSPHDQNAVQAILGQIGQDPGAELAFQNLLLKGKLASGTAADGSTLPQNLQEITVAPLAAGLDRARLLGGFLKELDDPMDTFQGMRNTCVSAVASMLMAQRYPAELARIVAGLASPGGSVQLINGKTLRRDANWQAPDGGRSQSQELLEPAFITYALQNTAEDQAPDLGAGGTLTYDNRTDKISDGGSGLSVAEADTLLSGVTNRQYTTVDFYGGRDPKKIAATVEKIAQIANQGDPVPVGIKWLGNVGHKVLVESIKNDTVTYLNPFGMREMMSIGDFKDRIENANLPAEWQTRSALPQVEALGKVSTKRPEVTDTAPSGGTRRSLPTS